MASPRAIWWLALGFAAACGQRERPTFPTENPGNGSGPITEIFQPDAADTVVVEGDPIFVQGRARDPDGVDAVYFEVGGSNQSFAPLDGQGADTVTFAIQLSTLGNPGGTIVVQIYSVDRLGDQGSTVTRQIRIQ
jgi:hypothetical protein